MGYRTLVMFNNDVVDQIKDDPGFGKRLHHLILQGTNPYNREGLSSVAWVVCQEHADVQKLAFIDGFEVKTLARRNWYRDCKQDEQALQLLKDAADAAGYRLVRKSS